MCPKQDENIGCPVSKTLLRWAVLQEQILQEYLVPGDPKVLVRWVRSVGKSHTSRPGSWLRVVLASGSVLSYDFCVQDGHLGTKTHSLTSSCPLCSHWIFARQSWGCGEGPFLCWASLSSTGTLPGGLGGKRCASLPREEIQPGTPSLDGLLVGYYNKLTLFVHLWILTKFCICSSQLQKLLRV